ncbi:MAG: type II toxin-antitoxin system YafQ family toxin [Patescibacteria group bacterium]
MLQLKYSGTFKKDLKKVSGLPQFNRSHVERILARLAGGERLEPRYRNHVLKGRFQGCFECHLRPDLLLIYQIDRQAHLLLLLRIGSHSELFG